MKTVKEIKIKATKAYTKKVEVILCDICGVEEKGTMLHPKITKCTLCGRHIHYGYHSIGKCSNYYDDNTDYPQYYCIYCYKLRFQTYRQEVQTIEADYQSKIEALEKKIVEESLRISKKEER